MNRFYLVVMDTVYTKQYDFLSRVGMFLELFRFAKKMKFLTKGGIHCISRTSLALLSLVELMEHDNSAADIIKQSSMYIHVLLQGRSPW